ncbi:YibE/F family protein [Alkaliphilus hydrothermalis]|uniref:Membrane protein n=1 Tax=Alkaliphilus hydrothermalis TaxID=1482730 RepID=A0ABS2NT85_9FIRM|nr:YibE/F family protein [Alkaliphilus hydrothermalis]MBM7615789.1 putative membrane protein [Alkaliphilus hydrothermalis]
MNRPLKKKFLLSLILFLIALSFTSMGFALGEEEPLNSYTARGKVLEVTEGSPQQDVAFLETYMVTLEILTGELKGEIFEIEHTLSGSFVYDIEVEPGDKVLLMVEEFPDGLEIYITDFIRDTYVYGVIFAFFALLIIIGKKSGFKTLITLALTGFFIMKVLLPGILKGYDPVLLTIVVSSLITLITIFIIGGINIKGFSAIAGVLGGILAAGLITFIIGTRVKLTGLSAEEATMLMYIPQNIEFDFRQLLFSGIMLGALGAVMDVAMSVSSAMAEIKRVNPTIRGRELIKSGMNVGRDIMGSMANTLILAYAGSTIPLLLLFMAYETSIVKIINLDIIATEIIRAIAGSIGLILTIPITAFTSGFLLERFKGKQVNE